MKKPLGICLFTAALAGLPNGTCAPRSCPTQFDPSSFTKGDFFTNFNNSCYLIPLSTGHGSAKQWGDLNTVYNKIYFNVSPDIPPYELVIIGQFPNARYFSVAVNDAHSSASQSLTDVDIVPFTAHDTNPFQPGVAFVSGQRYVVPVTLGGTLGTLEPGCTMAGYNADVNTVDGSLRHPFMNWNLDTAFFLANPTMLFHQVDTPGHANPSKAGAILIRNYLSLTASSPTTSPHVIVRDMASGCAYPATMVTAMNILTTDSDVGNTWLEQQQVQEHNFYASWRPTQCWGANSASQMQIVRGDEYIPGPDPDGSYLYAYVPSGLPQTLSDAGEVLRLRFRVPITPPTPCTNGCSRSGNEQLRYMSVSFDIPGGTTLASVPDSCPANSPLPCTPMVQDPNGFVTLIVGTGAAQPAWVTSANGYTWLDLTKVATGDYHTLNQIMIRQILPASTFACSGTVVPYKTGEATGSATGLMGLYAPVIDYPVATSLPQTASPLTGNSSCGVFPTGPGYNSPTCGVQLPTAPQIAAVTTQCSQPGCNTVVAQAQPPISILAASGGFGNFPLGLPHRGNTNYLRITDSTQNWSAGFVGDPCTVDVGEWSDNLISVVANVNQNGVCPMQAGDQLIVTVWNPQTLASASLSLTVMASGDLRTARY